MSLVWGKDSSLVLSLINVYKMYGEQRTEGQMMYHPWLPNSTMECPGNIKPTKQYKIEYNSGKEIRFSARN